MAVAVFERLLHRRTVVRATVIEEPDAEREASGAASPPVADRAGREEAEAVVDQGADGPAHWEPECGTPVHSKAHRIT